MTNNNYTTFNCAALEFDLVLGTVKNALGETQRLSPINLKLLAHLVGHQGEMVSRAELFDAIWPNQIVSDDVLTRAVSDVRTQLAKLDSSAKFIETLPKRGYRWIQGTCPASEQVASGASVLQASSILNESEFPSTVLNHMSRQFGHVLFYVVAAFLLAGGIMWFIGQSMISEINVAVLPTGYDRPQISVVAKAVDENLLRVLRNNPHIKLVSKSAIDSRPQKPFPYFFSEFGAKWVIESRVSDLDGINRVELSVVDARTGLELRSASFDAASNTELLTKLAKKLEAHLLVDDVGY
ncbi:MAG TPA: winged helix-turn-helix domain-containing protein [Cellvibrio sp.]